MYDRGCNIGIMCDKDNSNPKIDDKLATLRFICDNKSHITVDIEKCKKCESKNCLYFCPADVYSKDDVKIISVDYENCLECGTCRICCPYNAISWNYPEGGHGVRYRFG